MKKIILLLLTASLLFCCVSCGAEKSPDNNAQPDIQEGAVTFTDALGREISVKKPKRVAALLGSFADIWYLSGGTIVAGPDDLWEDFDLPIADDTINLGNVKKPNLELLIAANPDFVIASSNTKANLDFLDTLEKAGITVAYFNVSTFDDYLGMLKICTDITGRHDLYEKNGTAVQTQIASVVEKSKIRTEQSGSPSVLSLRASAASIRAKNSNNNVLGEMLKTLGCTNIADTNSAFLENLNIEYIMEKDPEYIFFVQLGDNIEGTKQRIAKFIEDNPAWNQLTAVKENRVFFMDKHLYNMKPNAKWGEAYEKLEQILNNK